MSPLIAVLAATKGQRLENEIDVGKVLYFLFGVSHGKQPNALERLAHATTNKGYSPGESAPSA